MNDGPHDRRKDARARQEDGKAIEQKGGDDEVFQDATIVTLPRLIKAGT